jgi:putative chitinase
MPIQLTPEGMRAIFPKAPQPVIDAFIAKQNTLADAGVNFTRPRLADFCANIGHECNDFTIPGLKENINYSAERMAQVWPNRFKSADAVRAKYGTAPGWQLKAFDDIYGGRMGNRAGTSDGSRYIGRGGPQWTGRDGYAECGRRTGLPALSVPDSICAYDVQPEVSAAFWSWKDLNPKSDAGDFTGLVKRWNGGTNGLADRKSRRARYLDIVKNLPGSPPTPEPPKHVIDAATTKERATRNAGIATGGAGAAHEATVAADVNKPLLSPIVTYSLIGVGVAVILVATFLIVRKKAAVVRNWF